MRWSRKSNLIQGLHIFFNIFPSAYFRQWAISQSIDRVVMVDMDARYVYAIIIGIVAGIVLNIAHIVTIIINLISLFVLPILPLGFGLIAGHIALIVPGRHRRIHGTAGPEAIRGQWNKGGSGGRPGLGHRRTGCLAAGQPPGSDRRCGRRCSCRLLCRRRR